jgi:hypothetical protein
VARAGQRVPSNYVIRTAANGSAELITRGRVVYVGGNGHAAAVAVTDGAHQQLRTGVAVVDAQHGPGVVLDVAGDSLSVPDGSAVEAMRSVYVTAGSLVGPSTLTNSSARTVMIPPLYQAVVSGDALPTRTTPLALSDSPAEAAVVPALVSADQRLRQLAAGIDNSGPTLGRVVLTSWTRHDVTVPLPAGTPRSEQVLPIVIADATSGFKDAQDRYNRVLLWRSQGGSWGVVLAILNGSESTVAAAFDNYTGGQATPHIGQVSFRHLAASQSPHGSRSPNPHRSTRPTSHPTPSPSGSHQPSPKPTSSKSPTGQVVGTVNTVVKKVIGLVPTLGPKPGSSKSPGLLGTLLGR